MKHEVFSECSLLFSFGELLKINNENISKGQ